MVVSLRIGIEIEVLLYAYKMQDQCKPCPQAFADSLVSYYNTKGRESPGHIEMRTAFDVWHASDDPVNFRYWSVNDESSIDPDEDHCKHLNNLAVPPWGLEFVSPIIRYEDGSLWRQNLHLHFQIIESYARIMSDVTCGTHIRVSPGESEWTLQQVKNVSRSILYFEEAFEALLPSERRGNRECRSNRCHNPKLRHLGDLESCFQKIQDCATMKALTRLMNAREKDAPVVYTEPDENKPKTTRCYGFNLENLMDGKIGTIEYRQPPCVTTYEDCVMWAEFGASFMQAAMQYGTSPTDLRAYGADVAGLAAFIRQATIPGVNDEGILDRIFARGSGSLPVGPMRYDHYY